MVLSLQRKYLFNKIKYFAQEKIAFGDFENNEVAIKCYEACGFKRVKLGIVESCYCMGETWICLDPDKIEKIQNNFYSIGGRCYGYGSRIYLCRVSNYLYFE